MNPVKKNTMRKFLPVLIILFGAAIMVGLTASRKRPTQQTPSFPGVLVEVLEARTDDRVVTINGNGTVKSAQEIKLTPLVSGRIDWLDPDFVNGGRFKTGESMLRIEQVDYQLAVNQARAAVASAEYALAIAEANARIAQQEWETMKTNRQRFKLPDREPDALVIHEPQLKQAEANLASAKATLEIAELHLQRTEITAPFNCIISQESIDLGQSVNQNSVLAVLYSTDVAEIEIGIPQSDLEWIDIPGAKANVKLELNGFTNIWQGKVVRSLGVLNDKERLARIIVQVRKPLEKLAENNTTLAIGSFVDVEIQGKLLKNVIAIPRFALRENNTVWISDKGVLEIREAAVRRLLPDEAIISDGINAGDQVVVSSIKGAASGLKLRLMEEVLSQEQSATKQAGQQR